MKKPYLLLLLAPVLVFGGCSRNQAAQQTNPQINQEQTSIPTTTKPQLTATSTVEEITAHDPFVPVIKGDDIFCFDKKIGTYKNGRLYMKLDDKIVSFVPPKLSGTDVGDFNLNDLMCESSNARPDDEGYTNYQYSHFIFQGLEVSTKLYGSYAVYKTIETPEDNNKITYRCDGSLAKTGDKVGEYTKDEPYFDCQTNGRDFLTQYEFNGAAGAPILTTGGDYGKKWNKIYIKRLDGLNYIFMGSLSLNYEDNWSSDYSMEKFRELSSRDALNELLKAPFNTKSLALWQMLIDSFRIEAKDEFGLK